MADRSITVLPGIVLVMVLLFPTIGEGQQKSRMQQFRELSRPVKWWVITHPFSASRSFEISLHAREVAREMENHPELDGDGSGGQVDAFRHAYWMALMAKEINPRRAWRLGYDHEKGNKLYYSKYRGESEKWLPTAADCTMDMFNNEMGIDIGVKYQDATREELQEIVLNKVLDGHLIIIKKDEMGQLLDCDGIPIDKEKYFHHWSIPVCLVLSSYNPFVNPDKSNSYKYNNP